MVKLTDVIYNNAFCNLKFNNKIGDETIIENCLKNINMDNYDIYEFGTYKGQSIAGIFEYIEYHNINFNNFIGFDSLKGIPLEKIDKNNNPSWTKGRFQYQKY